MKHVSTLRPLFVAVSMIGGAAAILVPARPAHAACPPVCRVEHECYWDVYPCGSNPDGTVFWCREYVCEPVEVCEVPPTCPVRPLVDELPPLYEVPPLENPFDPPPFDPPRPVDPPFELPPLFSR